MRRSEFKTVFILFLVLALFAVPAAAGSAERVLPASVNTGEGFRVLVNIADYGEAGQLLEKLPQGFTFVGSNLPERAVTVNGNRISFLLIDEKSFSYILKAPPTPGTYKFVGLLRDVDKVDFPMLPADSSIEVKVPSSGSSQSSSEGNVGGSSGSSGAGTEPKDNIETRELSQEFINSGQHVKFEFPEDSTCIRYVEFDSRKTLGKVTTIAEMLKGQSKLVLSLPAGEIYKNVNIWMETGGSTSSESIENATIGFKVEKAWLEKSGANSSSVALWHYGTDWSKLETQKVGEDSTNVYFEAKTPGFGHFVITVNNKSDDTESSGSTANNPIGSENSGTEAVSKPDKPVSKTTSSLPGFEPAVLAFVFVAVYCVLGRKS